PRFFCPQAFRECAIGEDTVLHPMERIGPAPKETRVVSLTGPLAILARCDDHAKQISGCPWSALTSLLRFYDKDCRWLTFYRITDKIHRKLRLDYNAFDHAAPVSCQMCHARITSSNKLVAHLFSQGHKQKVADLGTSIDKDAFSYWSEAIDSSFDGSRCRCEYQMSFGESNSSPVFETEKPQEEAESKSAGSMSREEVVEISSSIQTTMLSQSAETREIFRPRFFCPQAFRLVVNKTSTALHEMNRVCSAYSTMINKTINPVLLSGRLAILARCDDPTKKLKEDAQVALKRLYKFNSCNQQKLCNETYSFFLTMRCNFDEFNHPSSVACELCEWPIPSPRSLLKHVSSAIHLNKMQQLGTSVNEKAYRYWNKIINQCFDVKDPPPVTVEKEWSVEEVQESLQPLECTNLSQSHALLSSQALLPLTVLCYSRSVQDPCENLEDFLTKMSEKFNALNNEKRASLEALELPSIFDQPVYCKVCRDSNSIYSPLILIAHITSKAHIEKACRFGGTASIEALAKWMNLLEN
ncbi:hypothetical protein PENTCL1PPCAC_8064, partial [Pristionchus entomophagus]